MRILGYLFLLICIGSYSKVLATHGSHTEISYRWIQDSTYEITLWSFRRCEVRNIPNTISLRVISQNLNYKGTVSLHLDTIAANNSALVKPNMPFECGDFDTIATCRQQYVYRGTWRSSGRSNDWILYYQECCRIGGRLDGPPWGLENIEYTTFYIEIGIDNLTISPEDARNISPIWHNPLPHIQNHLNDTVINYPVNTLCQNKSYNLDQGVKEYDGDSLVFNFFHPQSANNDTVPYRLNYSLINPIPSKTIPLKIDQNNGIIFINPSSPLESGSFVLGIQVDEYRNGNHLGYIRREIYLHITDSVSNGITQINKSKLLIYPNPSPGNFTIAINQSQDFIVSVLNTDGRLVYRKSIVNESEISIFLPSELNNGLYFIQVIGKAVNHREKFVLVR